MIVDMTPQECAIAHLLAVMRHSTCRSNNINDKQMGGQDAIEIDRDGILVKMTVGKPINRYPDFSIYPRKGGVDLVGANGKKIDVKSTRYKNGKLLVHKDKSSEEIDVYILVVIDERTANVVGYIESAEVFKDENLRDLGHGVGYAIEQEKLRRL